MQQPNREASEHAVDDELASRPESAAQPQPRDDDQPSRQERAGILHRWPGSSRRQERPAAAVEEREPRGVSVPQPAINAAQVVMLLIGIVYVGIGAVALSRGGFDELNLHNQVMGIPHTPLLGFMTLVFGALVVLAAALPYAGRWLLLAGGTVLFVVGLVFVITPGTFTPALGVEALNGWIYMATGVVTLLVGIIMPRAAE